MPAPGEAAGTGEAPGGTAAGDMASGPVDLTAVQGLLAAWWFAYDQADVDAWPGFFTADAHFACRSDTGRAPYEDFIRADVTGRDAVLAWQTDHRRQSPYPLRHSATNVHVVAARPGEADFRSYLVVTHIVGGAVANLSTGVCTGTARAEGGAVRLADLRVVLDTTDSVPYAEVERRRATVSDDQPRPRAGA